MILCVDIGINEWWNDIWGASTVLTAPLGSECDFDPEDEYNNYGFTVDGLGATITVAYCAGSCDATCSDPVCGDGVCNGDETADSCPDDCEDLSINGIENNKVLPFDFGITDISPNPFNPYVKINFYIIFVAKFIYYSS